MGVYMSKPIRDKVSSDCDNKYLKCGASSMQGWRMSQEDAHNCCLDFDETISLFAVYDGHGGHEVAEYAAEHLPNFIKDNESYKKGDYKTSLIESFLQFDATLKTPPVMEKLAKIAKNGKRNEGTKVNEEEEEEEEEAAVQKLREEADMPLSEVIAMYASGGFPKTPKSKLLGGPSPMSPFLRAKPSSSAGGKDVSDSEVSSSSGPPPSITNGAHEKAEESAEPDSTKPSEVKAGKAAAECSSSSGAEVSSSSSTSTNGEVAPSSTSKDESAEPSTNGKPESAKEQPSPSKEEGSSSSKLAASKKEKKERAAKTISGLALKILQESFASEEEDSSADETFEANDVEASSSDEEVQLNGSKESEEGEEEDDDEEDVDEEGAEEESEDDEEEVDESDLEAMGMRSDADEPGMDSGCTAVVALVTKDKLFVANAGDSRAVLSRLGQAVDLSIDHKPEDLIELKRIQNAGGRVTSDGRVNGGLNLSRALGDHFYKKSADLDAKEQMITALPDVVEQTLDRSVDEFIVLACDGIWNSKSSQQVVDFVRPLLQKGETLSAICEQLFEACLAPDTSGDGTGCDNMTCVIVQLLPLDSTESKKRAASPELEKPSETEEPNSKKAKLTAES